MTYGIYFFFATFSQFHFHFDHFSNIDIVFDAYDDDMIITIHLLLFFFFPHSLLFENPFIILNLNKSNEEFRKMTFNHKSLRSIHLTQTIFAILEHQQTHLFDRRHCTITHNTFSVTLKMRQNWKKKKKMILYLSA